MQGIKPGQVLFGASFIALGALSLGWHDFAAAWPLVPKAVVWHDRLALLFAGLLLAGGLALLAPRTATVASLGLAFVLTTQMLLLQLPSIIAHPLVEGVWESASENLIYVAGAWTIFWLQPRQEPARFGSVRAGQILFALALPAIGLSHIVYLDQTAPLIPAWLPFHVTLAYFTGCAHIAAGIGIIFGLRIAAVLEAIMVSLFTLLVWVPKLILAPTNAATWTELWVSAAITGAAWAVADSFRDKAAGAVGKSPAD